jgi:ChpA-C
VLRRVVSGAAVGVAALGVPLAAAGVAQAHEGQGSLVYAPVTTQVNNCGNTVNVVGLLNPAFGNTCAIQDGETNVVETGATQGPAVADVPLALPGQ